MVGAASEEAAGDIELRALAGERRKHLIARKPRPGGQLKAHDRRRLADLARPGGEMCGLAGVGDALDVRDLGAFGDRELRAALDLCFAAAPSSATCASISVSFAPASTATMLRVVIGFGPLAGAREHQQHRTFRHPPLADLEQHAVRHEGEVERAHRILGLDRLAVELAAPATSAQPSASRTWS